MVLNIKFKKNLELCLICLIFSFLYFKWEGEENLNKSRERRKRKKLKGNKKGIKTWNEEEKWRMKWKIWFNDKIGRFFLVSSVLIRSTSVFLRLLYYNLFLPLLPSSPLLINKFKIYLLAMACLLKLSISVLQVSDQFRPVCLWCYHHLFSIPLEVLCSVLHIQGPCTHF